MSLEEKDIALRGYTVWFRNLWEQDDSEYEFYKLAKEMKPDITFSEFDKGWQYRLVLHPNYKEAKSEFLNVLWGWY